MFNISVFDLISLIGFSSSLFFTIFVVVFVFCNLLNSAVKYSSLANILLKSFIEYLDVSKGSSLLRGTKPNTPLSYIILYKTVLYAFLVASHLVRLIYCKGDLSLSSWI